MKRSIEAKLSTPVDMGGYLIWREFTLRLTNAEDDPKPDLVMDLEVRGDRVECRALHLIAKPNGRDLRTSDVRAVRLDDFIRMAVGMAAQPVASRDKGIVSIDLDDYDGRREAGSDAEKRRRKISDSLRRDVAEVHTAAREAGVAADTAVAEHFGVSHRTAVRYVKDARDKGFLPPLNQGKGAS